jgi:hypothetical protein
MWSTFWWVTNGLGVLGLAVCLIQGIRRRSLGLIFLAVYFAFNLATTIVAAVEKHQRDAEYVAHFVRQQIGPNTWTAPVLQQSVNLAAPFTQGILVLAAIFLARGIAGDRVSSVKRV